MSHRSPTTTCFYGFFFSYSLLHESFLRLERPAGPATNSSISMCRWSKYKDHSYRWRTSTHIRHPANCTALLLLDRVTVVLGAYAVCSSSMNSVCVTVVGRMSFLCKTLAASSSLEDFAGCPGDAGQKYGEMKRTIGVTSGCCCVRKTG